MDLPNVRGGGSIAFDVTPEVVADGDSLSLTDTAMNGSAAVPNFDLNDLKLDIAPSATIKLGNTEITARVQVDPVHRRIDGGFASVQVFEW